MGTGVVGVVVVVVVVVLVVVGGASVGLATSGLIPQSRPVCRNSN